MADTKKNNSELQDFLMTLEHIPAQIIDASLKFSSDEDEKNIINSFAPTLRTQFKELATYISSASERASMQGIKEANEFLKISSGTTLGKNLKIALPSIGSIVGKLGIAGIIQEIKKIIEEILDLFGISLPKWIKKLLLIINQIINTILGGDSIRAKNMLSQSEQNYLAELKGYALYKRASNAFDTDDGDDD